MSKTKNPPRNSQIVLEREHPWHEIKVLREKRSGSNGDVIALTVEHLPPGAGRARSNLRITRRQGGAKGIEIVFLSEDFYARAYFDAAGELKVNFDAVREKFEVAFEHEAAKMDADDALDAVDKILQE